MDNFNDIFKQFSDRDSETEESANQLYKIFKSYVNAGFTEDQAMAILINTLTALIQKQ